MTIKPWTKLGKPEILAEGYRKNLSRQVFTDHTGHRQDFYFFEGVDWSVILAVTSSGKIVMVRQFKQGSDSISEEIPGGSLDSNQEETGVVANRELKEETGYTPSKIIPLGNFWLDSRSSHTIGHLFLGENCTRSTSPTPDQDEQTEVFLVSFKELILKITKNPSNHRTEALALMRAFPHLKKRYQWQIIWAFIGLMFK